MITDIDFTAAKESSDDLNEELSFATEAEAQEYMYTEIKKLGAEALEFYLSESYDVADEGENWDMYSTVKQDIKSAQASYKEARKALKAKDAHTFDTKMNEVIAKFESSRKKVDGMPQDVSTAILGYFAWLFKDFGLLMIFDLTPLKLAADIIRVKKIIQFWMTVISNIKNNATKPSDWNFYTREIKSDLNIYIDIYKTIKTKGDAKLQNATTESWDSESWDSESWDIDIEALLCPDCVKTLLDQVKTNIDNSCKTVEDCDKMAEKVKDEAAKFNKCLDTMAEAAKGFQAGTVTKDELAATCNPCLAELRASCDVLKFDKCCDDSQDVTDEDIANLRAFIIGVHDMIAKKRSELVAPTEVPVNATSKDGPDSNADKKCDEHECKTIESYVFVDSAEESELSFVLRQKFGFDSKAAKATVKEGKQHLRAKEFDEAIACFKKAKTMYSSALTKCRNMPDKIKTANYLTNDHDITGRKTGETYKEASFTKTSAMNTFTKKIGDMDNLIDKAMQKKRQLKAKASESFIDVEAELGLAVPAEEEYVSIDIEAELDIGNDPEVQDASDESNENIDIEAELDISNALEEELDTSSDDDPELDEDLDDAVGEPESNDHNDEDPNAATKEILD